MVIHSISFSGDNKSEVESQSADSDEARGEEDEWHLMGAALEREFLGLED